MRFVHLADAIWTPLYGQGRICGGASGKGEDKLFPGGRLGLNRRLPCSSSQGTSDNDLLSFATERFSWGGRRLKRAACRFLSTETTTRASQATGPMPSHGQRMLPSFSMEPPRQWKSMPKAGQLAM